MKKIVLLQAIYNSDNPERQAEIDFCVKQNTENTLIDKYLRMEGRPTFNQCFEATRKYQAEHNEDNIFCFGNSDIYLPQETCEKVKRFSQTRDCSKICFALSRWDLLPDGSVVHYNHLDSQDFYVFFGAIPDMEGADFVTGGIGGTDNRACHIFHENGYTVINPSKDIRTIHVHNTNHRTYVTNKTSAIPPPYRLVAPSYLPL